VADSSLGSSETSYGVVATSSDDAHGSVAPGSVAPGPPPPSAQARASATDSWVLPQCPHRIVATRPL